MIGSEIFYRLTVYHKKILKYETDFKTNNVCRHYVLIFLYFTKSQNSRSFFIINIKQ